MKSYTETGKFYGYEISTAGRRNAPQQEPLFKIVREDFLTLLIENIETRFARVDLLDAMQVRDP
jgi:hypothetical protein